VQRVNNGDAPFLINIGKVRTGKTYSAAAVMNALGFGTYLDMPELELKLSTADRYNAKETREDLMHRLARCRLLVLDEIGRFPHKKQQEQEVLFYLINTRYQNRRPTILCSNLNGEEFAQHLGEALIDRIASRRVRIDLNGQSLRR
jgi:DNA replication protein DnaC